MTDTCLSLEEVVASLRHVSESLIDVSTSACSEDNRRGRAVVWRFICQL